MSDCKNNGGAPLKTLYRRIDLIEPEEDISSFLGREGHAESRPRLGPDAPAEVRPDKEEPLNPLVCRLVEGHPDDTLAPSFGGGAPLSGV